MISIVIPVNNQGRSLKKCLVHLLSQQPIDFEIILIDDASTDNSLEVAKTILATHPDVRIVEHKTKKGLWETRREAICMARGSHLFFLDPREWLEPTALKRLYDTISTFNVDLVQMRRQRYIHNMPLKLVDHPEAVYWHIYTDEEYRYLTRFVGVGSCISPFCDDKLYRTDLLREASTMEFQGEWGEVQLLNINYLRLARSLVLIDFAGINADWVHNHYNFNFSRLDDYKRLHTLKRCLCADSKAADKELVELLHFHVNQLLGELSWTPEAVEYFVGRELRNPIWQQVGVNPDVKELIATTRTNLRQNRYRQLLKRLIK